MAPINMDETTSETEPMASGAQQAVETAHEAPPAPAFDATPWPVPTRPALRPLKLSRPWGPRLWTATLAAALLFTAGGLALLYLDDTSFQKTAAQLNSDNQSLKGQPTLLIFWAPWCNVCQRELPLMAQFHAQEKPPQLRLISIGFADRRRNVEEYVYSHQSTFVFPTAYDIDNDVSQAFKITVTPTYVLLDSQGRIVLVHRGGGLLQTAHFREFLTTLK